MPDKEPKPKTEQARDLRRRMPSPERYLWSLLLAGGATGGLSASASAGARVNHRSMSAARSARVGKPPVAPGVLTERRQLVNRGNADELENDDDSAVERTVNLAIYLWAITSDAGFRVGKTREGTYILFWKNRDDCEKYFEKRHLPSEEIDSVGFSELMTFASHHASDPPPGVAGIVICHPSDQGGRIQTLSFPEAVEVLSLMRSTFLRKIDGE